MSTRLDTLLKQASIRPSRSGLRLLVLPVLSVAGVGVSGYLTYTHLAHAAPLCSVVRGCETVTGSPYATVGDVPVALLGLGLYTLMLALSVVALWGPARAQPWALLGVFGLSLSGALYSAYLSSIATFVLQALCPWCLASAAIVTVMLGFSAWALLRPRAEFPVQD